MNARVLLTGIIRPAMTILEGCDGPKAGNTRAERMLVAIAAQESALMYRVQMGGGPATGLWQFERAGGVAGVLRHPASRAAAAEMCRLLLVRPEVETVHLTLVNNDLLGAAFARLLLLTDPQPLPDDQDAAWSYYLRTWRPGKPRPTKWAASWRVAGEALGATIAV